MNTKRMEALVGSRLRCFDLLSPDSDLKLLLGAARGTLPMKSELSERLESQVRSEYSKLYVSSFIAEHFRTTCDSLLCDGSRGSIEARFRCAILPDSEWFSIDPEQREAFLRTAVKAGHQGALIHDFLSAFPRPSIVEASKLIQYAQNGLNLSKLHQHPLDYQVLRKREAWWSEVLSSSLSLFLAQNDPKSPVSLFVQWSVGGLRFMPSAADPVKTLSDAALGGFSYAQFELSRVLQPIKAMKFLRLAADAGIREAQTELGHQLFSHALVPSDVKPALNYYQAALTQEDPRAEAELGSMAVLGQKVRKDTSLGLKMIHRAAIGDVRYFVNLVEAVKLLKPGSEGKVLARSVWGLLACLTGQRQGMEKLFQSWEQGYGLTSHPLEGELLLSLCPQASVTSYRSSADEAIVPIGGSEGRIAMLEPEQNAEAKPTSLDTDNKSITEVTLTHAKKLEREQLNSSNDQERGVIANPQSPSTLTDSASALPKSSRSVHQSVVLDRSTEASSANENTTRNMASNTEGPLHELEDLIGFEDIRLCFHEIDACLRMQSQRHNFGLHPLEISLHHGFIGNPGTGKRTAAKILAGLLNRHGVVKTGHLVPVALSELAAYSKVVVAFEAAVDGILYIDSVSSVAPEEIQKLGSLLTKYTPRVTVVVAGYPEEMSVLMKANTGLASHIRRYIKFRDFSEKELIMIFRKLCNKGALHLTTDASILAEQIIQQGFTTKTPSFGNGREVRNFFDSMLSLQAVRLCRTGSLDQRNVAQIIATDIPNRFCGFRPF